MTIMHITLLLTASFISVSLFDLKCHRKLSKSSRYNGTFVKASCSAVWKFLQILQIMSKIILQTFLRIVQIIKKISVWTFLRIVQTIVKIVVRTILRIVKIIKKIIVWTFLRIVQTIMKIIEIFLRIVLTIMKITVQTFLRIMDTIMKIIIVIILRIVQTIKKIIFRQVCTNAECNQDWSESSLKDLPTVYDVFPPESSRAAGTSADERTTTGREVVPAPCVWCHG